MTARVDRLNDGSARAPDQVGDGGPHRFRLLRRRVMGRDAGLCDPLGASDYEYADEADEEEDDGEAESKALGQTLPR